MNDHQLERNILCLSCRAALLCFSGTANYAPYYESFDLNNRKKLATIVTSSLTTTPGMPPPGQCVVVRRKCQGVEKSSKELEEMRRSYVGIGKEII